MTYKEIYDITMPPSKKADEKYLFWERMLRVPAILLTMPLVGTKVKPTTVTKWSVLFVLISFALIAFGGNLGLKVYGWVCLLMWAILDCVDGQLARCSNQCSNLGDLWDTMGGYLAMICIYFSAGIAAFYDDSLISIYDNYICLILGGATAILSIFPRLIMQKKKNYGESKSVKEITDKPSFSLSKLLMQNLISPCGFIDFIFLLAILLHILNLFIAFYFIVNILVTVVTLSKLLKE